MSFQILNTKVIFDAHVTKIVLGYGDDSGHSGYLTFDQVDIDIGEAFDGSFFTAPIAGIYKMTFSGQNAMSDIDHTSISVYKNDNRMFGIMDFNVAVEWGDNVSYTWMMKLDVGDRVKLRSANDLYATSDFPLTFTGELIHIEN